MNIKTATVFDKLRELRLLADLTQEAAAEKTGIPLDDIQGYETGRYSPDPLTREKLCAMYDSCYTENRTGFSKLNERNRNSILLMAATYAHKSLSFSELFYKLDNKHKEEIVTMIKSDFERQLCEESARVQERKKQDSAIVYLRK